MSQQSTSTDRTPPPDFRLLFESSPGLYLILTPDLHIVAVSDAYLKATMTVRDQILGRGLFEVFPDNPDDPTATGVRNLRDSLNRVISGHIPDVMAVQKYDIRCPGPDGGGFEERYWSPTNFPVFAANNELVYIIHRVEDVTETVRLSHRGDALERLTHELRLRTEQLESAIILREQEIAQRKRITAELRRTEQRIRSIVDHVVDGIISIDEHGTVESYNAAAERIFGYQAAEVIGQNVNLLMPAPFRTQLDDFLQNHLRTEETQIVGPGREVVGLRKDGSTFPMDLAVSAFQFEQTRHFTGIVRDITRRKTLEAQFQQAQKMKVIGDLAGGVAHDFNNLLAVILGCCQFLENDACLSRGSREFVDDIFHAAMRAAGLTRQLLAFSRQQVLQPKIINLNGVVEEAAKMLERLIGEDIRMTTALSPDLWPVKVDSSQMNQVVMNLAVNARDAMSQGGMLTIETANVTVDEAYHQADPTLKEGDFIVLSVSDTGCGMSPETKSRIFEPFFTTKDVGKGTGLGLATVFGIVKQSQGHVTVYSEVGQGTVFNIYLPRVDSPSEMAREERPPTNSPRGTETVLIVEDEDLIRKLAGRILQSQGYTVLQARTPEEALHACQQISEPIHLVVSDVVMPQIGGRILYNRLRAIRPTLKVLFMSGYTDDAVIRHGVLEAETNYIQKPFTYAAFANAVREAIDA